MKASLSLKSMLAPSKTVTVDFPGFDGFKVNLSFMSRETLVNIRKKATKQSYKSRQVVDDLDDQLFLKLYVEAAVKGWEGLKLSYVEQLAPVELGENDPNAELEFSSENALFLMKESSSFDSFVSETVTELSNFTKNSKP
jgi:hypothetical protein